MNFFSQNFSKQVIFTKITLKINFSCWNFIIKTFFFRFSSANLKKKTKFRIFISLILFLNQNSIVFTLKMNFFSQNFSEQVIFTKITLKINFSYWNFIIKIFLSEKRPFSFIFHRQTWKTKRNLAFLAL